MNAAALITVAEAAGAELAPTPEGKLRVRSDRPLPPDLLARLAAAKAELLAALSARPALCPACMRDLDRGRCWWCHYRPCEACGERPTRSAFLSQCIQCDLGAGPGARPDRHPSPATAAGGQPR